MKLIISSYLSRLMLAGELSSVLAHPLSFHSLLLSLSFTGIRHHLNSLLAFWSLRTSALNQMSRSQRATATTTTTTANDDDDDPVSPGKLITFHLSFNLNARPAT